MSAAQTCPRCKAPLPEEGWEGLCPKCLVHVSLEAPDAGTPTSDSPHPVSGHPVPSETSTGRGQGERQGTPHHAPITDPRARIPDKAGDLPRESVPAPEAGLVIEQIGRRIGRYKLLQQIGEGGFGIVFMAEQTEPVQRKVALKVIKAGMDTREVIARFEAERQALALMDHPNIAKIYDAGITDAPHTASGHPLPSDGSPLPSEGRGQGEGKGAWRGAGEVAPYLSAGRPYFVMELVRGLPITNYCDQCKLSTRERLELFIKVCRAVQHAHQKGVIHRDLKPSNVLVTQHDGEPVPKVIDFGVAKALGQKLTDKTLFTRFEQMIGTPAYMSPEQAALGGLDIDTRSDIYSLGVLLYELLTGVTPFDAETLRQAALDEIRRMIQETEPPKPSTRLATLGERLIEVAKQRHADPATLNRLLRGDLDWINMKALEKDRHRRYETVNGLAADLERHLNHEPVLARPPSTLYRFERTVRRHRGAFAAGAAIAVALILGTVISTWQAVRATRAEREQRRERQRADEAADHAKRAEREAREQLWRSYLAHTNQASGRADRPPPAIHIPPRDPHSSAKSTDLSAFYNACLTNCLLNPTWVGNTLATLPAGRQTFDGTEFDIRGVIQLGGIHPDLAFDYPPEIKGVPVHQRCRTLHFLHAFGWLAPSGFQVGEYVVHYTDGKQMSVPLLNQENIACWYQKKDKHPPLNQSATEVWRGENLESRRNDCDVVLYHFRWANPRPEAEIATIDIRSAMAIAAPFLIAITAE